VYRINITQNQGEHILKLKLPKLEKEILKQGKNSIHQFLENEREIDLNIIKEESYFIDIEYDENIYHITLKRDTYPKDREYILVANKKPTHERLVKGEAKLNWFKHPKLKDYTSVNVIESWDRCFNFIEENKEKNLNGLRLPQIASIHSILSHLKISDKLGTVVMPTGTGKTETMLSTLVANQCTKLLVTVPSDSLREQLFEKFYTLGLLKQFSIINDTALYPIVGIIKTKFKTIEELENFFSHCNIIITTVDIVAGSSSIEQKKISELCSHYFIDEAHHVKASSWDRFRKQFKDNKVLQFTATPFRNDRKRLDGEIIFNFPLKKAQEQGYFSKIDFIPIREYNPDNADKRIVDIAVMKLREDIKNGFPHILMARCKTKKRADEIFELYKEHDDLSPVVIHTNIKDRKKVLTAIKNKEHKIIVCVDMLGEGFDLPELKIAAFHDIKKSLPITLQFAGRFTRTKYDEVLGNASFIVNLADNEVEDELKELYSQDADWNILLSTLSSGEIEEKINYADFITGFKNLKNSSIPFQNIRIAKSTVVYKNTLNKWNPENFKAGIRNYEEYDYKFHDINEEHNILVIITAQKSYLDWGDIKEIYHLDWNIIVAHYDKENKLLYIHSSDKGFHKELATALIGDSSELISGLDIFKSFYDVKRVTLQNLGLKQFIGKNISFRMSMGSDIEKALSLKEQQSSQKAFVFGVGYEEGTQVSLGCSYKGKIWSHARGDLMEFINWCGNFSKKLLNPNIDGNQILSNTLNPKLVFNRPTTAYPVWVDWYYKMYDHRETKYTFWIGDDSYKFYECELNICDASIDGDLLFELVTNKGSMKFKIELFKKGDNADYKIVNLSTSTIYVSDGKNSIHIEDFFYKYTPRIWFADGSSLDGNEYITLKEVITPYPKENLIDNWDWSGVDLSKESQHVIKIKNSIQYKVIERLKIEDFDIIYDDDGSGEIADIVTMKLEKDKIKINFYHLKYASEGRVTNRISNFYEVCGQAQKSIHWKQKSGDEFISHLLRRETKKRKGNECSRLEKGTIKELENLIKIIKNNIPVEFVNYIVQPGASSSDISDEILILLGVTENYLMEYAQIPLKVVVNK